MKGGTCTHCRNLSTMKPQRSIVVMIPAFMILTTNASMHGRKTYLQDYKVATVHMRLQTQQKLARPRLEQLRDL